MRHPGFRPVRAIAAAIAVAAPSLSAQRDAPISVQVISSEEIGQSRSVDVLKSIAGVRTQIGTAQSGAPLQIDAVGQGFRLGDPISVNYHRRQLVLIDGRRPDAACLADLNSIPADRCQEIEVITAGSAAGYGVDAVAGVVNIITRKPTTLRAPVSHRFKVGLDYTASNFYKLDDVACNTDLIPGLGECSSDKSSNGIGVFGEFRLNDRFSIGARYSHNNYTVNQVYGTSEARHDVGVKAIDGYGKFNFGAGPKFKPYGLFGMSWYQNYDENYWEEEPDISREESGLRLLAGVGIEYQLARKVDFRAAIRLASGGSHDADSNYGGGLGLSFRF